MIRSFRDDEAKKIAAGLRSRFFPQDIQRTAQRKLDQLDSAILLTDLAIPGNRLEALKRDRKGQHSIRIDSQWRICFRWTPEAPKRWRSWIITEAGRTLRSPPHEFCS